LLCFSSSCVPLLPVSLDCTFGLTLRYYLLHKSTKSIALSRLKGHLSSCPGFSVTIYCNAFYMNRVPRDCYMHNRR
jgi:hypothetical protein